MDISNLTYDQVRTMSRRIYRKKCAKDWNVSHTLSRVSTRVEMELCRRLRQTPTFN